MIRKLIDEGSPVIDVRTPMEFAGGNVAGSLNIPLNEIPARLDELKLLKGPLILCCLSGNRSGQASAYLAAQQIECINGGSWFEVNAELATMEK